MDFLKMLLAYMALMGTLGVQTGPALDAVPTPTPLPAHVTPTVVPHMTEAPTATPSPTPEPTPVITPNYRYDTLDFGSSGNQVRKLQNRLIELGYLPEGSADSQYGYQTYNAVKAFQRANKLSADGVAGATTLTHLYENPFVVGVVEETAVPTATPTPSWAPFPTADATVTEAPTMYVIPLPEESAGPEALPEEEAAIQDDLAALPDGWVELEGGFIISGNTNRPLYLQRMIDGQDALVKPSLFETDNGDVAVYLNELAECLGWTVSAEDGATHVEANGYSLVLLLVGGEQTVMVDGTTLTLENDDVALWNGELLITGDFLRTALKADVVLDADEKSMVLFLTDKSVANAQD